MKLAATDLQIQKDGSGVDKIPIYLKILDHLKDLEFELFEFECELFECESHGTTKAPIKYTANFYDKITQNNRTWYIELKTNEEQTQSQEFEVTHNKRIIFNSLYIDDCIDHIQKINKELSTKYINSKNNAAMKKGDIRYIIADSIRKEAVKRKVHFESNATATGEIKYFIRLRKNIDYLLLCGLINHEMSIRVGTTEDPATIRINTGNLKYKLFLADPDVDPMKIADLIFNLFEKMTNLIAENNKYNENILNNEMKTWFEKENQCENTST